MSFNKCKLHVSSDFCRVSYRILKYGGYAGDLSPESAMELLRGNKNAVLIDIRPEARLKRQLFFSTCFVELIH